MTDVLKTAIAKAAANSSKMVAAGSKESYDDPMHQNHLKNGGRAKNKKSPKKKS